MSYGGEIGTNGKRKVDLRLRESSMREQLQLENQRLREKLREKEVQFATVESLSMEAI